MFKDWPSCAVLAALSLTSAACFDPNGTPDPTVGETTGTTVDGTTTPPTTTTSAGETTTTGTPPTTSSTELTTTTTTTGVTSDATTTEPSPACGDGSLDDGETCDDGNGIDEDACLNSCAKAACGDGVVHLGVEQCDDGSNNADDAPCRPDCIRGACGDLRLCTACGEECEFGTEGCDENCDWQNHYIFVSSEPRRADELGGLVGADAWCAEMAQKNALFSGRPFVAWLSTSTVDARDRIGHTFGYYVRPDLEPIAAGTEALLDAMIDAPINLDVLGVFVADTYPVWTGTLANGIKNAGDTLCGDWIEADGTGRVGVASAVDYFWTDADYRSCREPAYIYCVQRAY